MFFWIYSLEWFDASKCFLAESISFGEGFGFGSEFARSYSGPVLMVDGNGDRIAASVSVSLHHSSRGGLRVAIRWEQDLKPEFRVPFLLTSVLETQLIFRGDVRVRLSEFASQFEPECLTGVVSAVRTGGSAVALLQGCRLVEKSAIIGQLMLFSEQKSSDFSVVNMPLDFNQTDGPLGQVEALL